MAIDYVFLLLFGFYWIPFGESSVSKSDGLKLPRAIRNGKEAKPGEFPYAVALHYYHKDLDHHAYLCGGSLITTMAILTAAHCVYREGYLVGDINDYSGVLGTVDRMDRTNYVTFQEICVHPKHVGRYLWNDIALLISSKPVKLGYTIQTIPLLGAGVSVRGHRGVVLGWGRTGNCDLPASQVLLYAEVNILDPKTCETLSSNDIKKELCYGTEGKSICKGDSGSPIILHLRGRDVLVGIDSFKIGEDLHDASVGMNVSCYNTWIRNRVVGTPVFISW